MRGRARLQPISRLAAWDNRLSRAWTLPADARTSRPFAYRLAWIGAHLGDSWLWTIAAAWLWVRSRRAAANANDAPRDALGWAASLLTAAALTLTLKRWVRRVRPGSGIGLYKGLYGGGADVYSFPSGHAMRMGVLAVWTANISTPRRTAAAALALWVSVSRVRLGIHYVGDVVGGYLLGMAVARLIRRIVR